MNTASNLLRPAPLPGGARRRWLVAVLVALAVAGAAWVGHALWLPLKAQLAQSLLEEAWERARAGEPQPRPWPWADTWPVARLALPDETDRSPEATRPLVVLAGASGRTLAFGPGHLTGSAEPGEGGNVVIAGHRDTHFRRLGDLRTGDLVELEDAQGGRHPYRVQTARVVRYDDTSALRPAVDRLTLITCWPFEALHPGGPLRYVVTAESVSEPDRRITAAEASDL